MKSSCSPACFFWWGVSDCPRVGCVSEHKPVNVYHTGEMLKLWLCNDYHSLLSHWCKWCTIIQWMEARYLQKKKEKKLLLIIYCLKNETLCCVVMASTCFLLVSEWKLLQSSITEILLCFQMVHYRGNACYVQWHVAEFYACLLKYQNT